MKGIKGSRGYSNFVSIAPGYSQNYVKDKISILLGTNHDLTAGDVQSIKLFEVSKALAEKLTKQQLESDLEGGNV